MFLYNQVKGKIIYMYINTRMYIYIYMFACLVENSKLKLMPPSYMRCNYGPDTSYKMELGN